MRVALEFNGVQVRGAIALREPLVWPVWFAVDGDAMRALLGDVTASSWIHAPGPQAGTAALEWNRTLVPSGIPESASGVGLALLYTEGGKSSAAARAQYEAFSERVRQIALDAAAEAAGLAPLLAFRNAGRGQTPNIDALTKGIEHDILVSPGTDHDAPDDDAATAFAYVARMLAPLAPGSSVQRKEVTPSPVDVPIDAPIISPVAPSAPVRRVIPGLVTFPERIRPNLPRSTLGEGTVAASLIQFWPSANVARLRMTDIRRSLPTRTALRDTLRASLTLSGRLRREE
ncbi:MAG: hypothetical protein WCY26_12000 [Thiohalobacteraceae bacterium]